MTAFGSYTPTRADQLKDELDRDLGLIENRVRHLVGIVSDAGSISTRVDEALDILREATQDLQGVVDRRTDAGDSASTPAGGMW